MAVALVAAAGVGVAAAVALGVGDDNHPTARSPRRRPAPPRPRPPRPSPRSRRSSARSPSGTGRTSSVRPGTTSSSAPSGRPTSRIVSAKTGKPKAYKPKIGKGVDDGVLGFGSLWLSLARENTLVRLDPETGRPRGKPIALPSSPSNVAVSKDAVWAALVPGNDAPDVLVKLDPKTGQILTSVDYPYGIMSMTASPTALWVTARRRALVQRVDLKTGQVTRTKRVGNNRSEDIAYHAGALWIATPGDDTVNKLVIASGAIIPISVGHHPQQLTIGDGVVYVTNFNSSDLTTIDIKSSRVVGDPLGLPVNPYSLATDESGATLYVGSPPENKLTTIATGRGG